MRGEAQQRGRLYRSAQRAPLADRAHRDARIAPYDALVLPTTANTPPRIADLADDKAFTTQNLRALRNCTLINMIDGCAISLPAHREGEVPVGLMLAAPAARTAASSNLPPAWRA